ncbi:DUF3667 domain-containing protein [Sphingomonas astaxanthinifaciens]|uniref:DUF3667 domain-containing protein n=1 Tax=Sphingomonas astaxanthinifaciens DSM 22298 TaxID=1123267 RepID=A0ABQ5Z852_9SPHN|nr:DUF3667 domain-containing protein [Sphingomonas astaxanthinifaciens]GLR48122.1 hypothetical protein GCM10007925_18350 [Sphingomonas astaxanthinifaciens DSM 22298]
MNALEQPIVATGDASCLNCGTPLGGAFCANCGQKARINRSLAAFFSDLVAGLFNFESRFWRTLPMLAWCPGDLTRRYVEGQRARFISPIALYLFSVFLMFAALGASMGGDGGISFNSKVDESIVKTRQQIATLEKQRAQLSAKGASTASVDRKLAAERDDLGDLQKVKDGTIVGGFTDGTSQGPPQLVNAVKKATQNPREAMGHVQEAASKYSWVLIPISLPFMFLLFPLRRRHVFDHAVFVTYSLSFMMLLILAGSLMVLIGISNWVPLLLLLPPIHMYRQLKGAYQLRWWSALFRTFLLLNFAFIALGLFTAAVVALGLLS